MKLRSYELKFLIIIILLLTINVFTFAYSASDFAYLSEIDRNFLKGNIYFIDLDQQILQKSFNSMNDIRLFDLDGANIDYKMISLKGSYSEPEFVKIIKKDKDENGNQRLYIVTDNKTKEFFSIESSSFEYDFKVIIEASVDGKLFNKVGEDNIYSVSNLSGVLKNKIYLSSGKRSRYFRFTFLDTHDVLEKEFSKHDLLKKVKTNSKDFISDVKITTTYIGRPLKKYDRLVINNPDFKDDGEKYVYESSFKLPLEEIDLNISNPIFLRNVKIFVSSKDSKFSLNKEVNIYRMILAQGVGNTSIKLDGSYFDRIRIELEKKKGKPFRVNQLSYKWIRKRIYFTVKKNLSRIFFGIGNANLSEKDDAFGDLFKGQDLQTISAVNVKLIDLKRSQEYKKKPVKFEKPKEKSFVDKYLFHIILFIIAFIIIVWILFQFKEES